MSKNLKAASEETGSRRPSPAICSAMCFDNGNIAIFDGQGNQIPDLQVSWLTLWAMHAEKLGYNPDGVIFECQTGKSWRIFRTEDGGYNHELWPNTKISRSR